MASNVCISSVEFSFQLLAQLRFALYISAVSLTSATQGKAKSSFKSAKFTESSSQDERVEPSIT